MGISPKALNTQDTIHRPQEAQEEGRPKYEYFDPYLKVDQNTHVLQPTNRMNLGSPMEQLEKGRKELKRFAALQEEQ